MSTTTYDISDGVQFGQTLAADYKANGVMTAISIETVNVVNGLNPPTATCTFDAPPPSNTPTVKSYDISNGVVFGQFLAAVYKAGGIMTAISIETVNVVNGLNPPTASCTLANKT